MRTRPVHHAAAIFAALVVLSASGSALAGLVLEDEADGDLPPPAMVTNYNNDITNAQNLDGNFTSGTTPNAFGNSAPGWSISSVTGAVGVSNFLDGSTSHDVDFYEFTLLAQRLVVLDIDSGGQSDMMLWLFDSSGTLLFYDDQSTFAGPSNDPGSTTDNDPFIGQISLGAGIYYAAVSAWSNPALVYQRYYDVYPPYPGGNRAGTNTPAITGYSYRTGVYGTGGPNNYGAFSYPTGFELGALGDYGFLYNGVQPVGAATDGPYTLHISVNPEPSTLALFGLGALGLLGIVRRRRRRG